MAKYEYRPPCIYGERTKPPAKTVADDFEPEVTDKVCVICGGKFLPDRHRQSKTCSKGCSEILRRRATRQIGDRRCAYCGAEIPYTAHLNVKYCCAECLRFARRKADRERTAAERARIKREEIEVNATGQGVNASTWAAMQLLDPHSR